MSKIYVIYKCRMEETRILCALSDKEEANLTCDNLQTDDHTWDYYYSEIKLDE